jgi:uncharacterized protein (TIGR02594 family)
LLGIEQGKKPKTAAEPIGAGAVWMQVARREIGQSERVGSRHNPKIIKYHATTSLQAKTDETPWCSSFVNWVLKQVDIEGTNSAAAASWLKWGKSSPARAGAITVLRNDKAANSSLSRSGNHVGFLVKVTATHFLLLGGNQSNQVKLSRYPKKSWVLRGYRWPEQP